MQAQSKETRRLVLPENRHRRKKIGGSQQNPPCRLCFQRNKRCHLVGPTGSPCEGCKNNHLRCNWNLEGAKRSTNRTMKSEALKQTRYEKLGFVPVSRDRKCHRCAQRRIACNGGHPCNKCNITQLRLSCRPQGVEELPSCNQCSHANGKECDRGRPCKGCISKRQACIYEDQNGFLSRAYSAQDTSLPGGFSSVGPLAEWESFDEECVRCQRLKVNCDGEQPCYTCVKAPGTAKVASCRYRRSNGTSELWAVRPFEIQGPGEQSIRKDYAVYTGLRKRTVSKELRALRDSIKDGASLKERNDQSEPGNIVADDMDENEINARH